jgi:hypothetical protein
LVDDYFKKYDKDKNGSLDAGEVELLLNEISTSVPGSRKAQRSDILSFMKKVDANGD